MPLSSIVGHRQLLHLLSRGVSRGTLPPSLIFEGPDGVGKRLAATALAQMLNCETPASPANSDGLPIDACGRCRACLRIARGSHSDVLLLAPGDTGHINIDQVREAIDRAAFRPFEGRRRVVIIDRAEALLGPAQNALLKILEEPPSASVFVLVTAQPDMLLPTVRSRCPKLRFGPLSTADVVHVLMQAHGIDSPEARAAAAGSGGSVGRALESRGRESGEARERAARLLEALATESDPRRKLERAKEFVGSGSPKGQASAEREQLARRLDALSALLRDIQVLASDADERWLSNLDLAPALRRLVGAFDRARATSAFSSIGRALDALDRNASPKIVADWIVFQV